MSSAYATLEEATKRLHDYGHKGPETLKGRHGTAERMVKFLPAFVANHKMPTFNLSPDSLLNGSAGGVGWINNTDLSEAVKREQEVAAMAATPTGRSSTDKACGLAPALHPAWSRPLDKAGPTPAKAGAVIPRRRDDSARGPAVAAALPRAAAAVDAQFPSTPSSSQEPKERDKLTIQRRQQQEIDALRARVDALERAQQAAAAGARTGRGGGTPSPKPARLG